MEDILRNLLWHVENQIEDDTFQLVHQVEDLAQDDTYSDMHSVHQSQAPIYHIWKIRKMKLLRSRMEVSIKDHIFLLGETGH
jgi:hypothetical protein